MIVRFFRHSKSKFCCQMSHFSQSTVQPILISVEGNVGAGKSTLIEELKSRHSDWNFIAEPVDIWSSIANNEGESLLSVYYKKPKRWSYSFQSCALLSRFQNIQNAIVEHAKKKDKEQLVSRQEKGFRPIFVTERCLDTDYNVFAKMLRDQGSMDKLEFEIYHRLYYHLRSTMTVPLTAIIHVDTSPENCLQNIATRNRTGESALSLTYLQSLDKYQSDWMNSLIDVPIVKSSSGVSGYAISEIDSFVNRQLVSAEDRRFYNVCL